VRTTIATIVTFVMTAFGFSDNQSAETGGMNRTFCGDGREWIRIIAGTGRDGYEVCGDGWGRD